ncbi:MAG TPA: primosomal protein N', partial [Allosphingosinicella sp.]
MHRVRVILLNAALGPLDYRAPKGMPAPPPGTIVLAPLGPRQITGVVWEANRLEAGEVDDKRLRPLLQVYDLPPIAEPLRRLIEWTADYYLAPIAAVLRMTIASASALDGARTITEYRATGLIPDRLTPQ